MSTLLMVLCLVMLAITLAVKVAVCPPGRVRRLVRLGGLAVVAAFAVLFVAPSVAHAAVPPGADVPVGPDTDADSLFTLTPFVVQAIGGALIPYLIAFVTNQKIAAWFKKALTALLSAVVGVVTTAAVDGAGNSIITLSALESAFFAFLSAAGVYTFFVRNSGTETKLNELGPNIGPAKAA